MIGLLLEVVVVLLIVGLVLWGIEQIPIDGTIRNFIRVAVIVIVGIWLILLIAGVLGISPSWGNYPRLK